MTDESQVPDAKTQMAGKRTDMAVDRTSWAGQRTLLAEERTLMAWIRTALSMISFGFTIYKFFQYLIEAEKITTFRISGPRSVGLGFLIVGTLALVLATVQYWRAVAELHESPLRSRWTLALVIALLVCLIGLMAISNVLLKVGPF
ncbi:MAG: DUF202 domain-containing protein [Anaerolineae bacterium]|nr:DUF202 domain-containing protein [Anaerolineae bacterium]